MRAALAARAACVVVVLALFAAPEVVAAQAPPPSHERGLVLRSADGASSVRVMGLFQLQYAHGWPGDGAETDGLFVQRARVGLSGSAFTRDLRYMLVAELGGGDLRLLFLHLDYTLVPDWLTVRVGQFKRPLSRSFLTMASQLSMIDRPITIGPRVFGDSVDTGVMLHDGSSGAFEYAVGVFSGAELGAIPERLRPVVAARLGLNTDGLSGYTESDLEGGPPRFGIAIAGLADLGGNRDGEPFVSGVVDLTLKAYGLSLASALYVGARRSGSTESATLGHSTQIGYVIAGVVEPVVRYAFVLPSEGPGRHDLAGGLNVYFEGHALALRTSVAVRLEGTADAPDVLLQSQLALSL